MRTSSTPSTRPRSAPFCTRVRSACPLAASSSSVRSQRSSLLGDLSDDSEFAQHETFGPVVAIDIVDSGEEAVARANSTSYGLSSGILTSNPDRGFQLAQQLEAGLVHVNDQPVGDEPQMPFGGTKDSGYGRFGGQAAIDEFTELRWITIQAGTHPFP